MAQWRIIGQREFEELLEPGQFVPMVEVSFEIRPSGQRGSVVIPKRELTVERAREEVAAAAETKARIQDLAE